MAEEEGGNVKKVIFLSIVLAVFFLMGCNNSDNTGNPGKEGNKPGEDISSVINSKGGQNSAEFVPDWLYQSLLAKFDLDAENDLELPREAITLVRVNMKNSAGPQIAAYLTLNRVEGYFLLYEFAEGNYKEVYSLHQPVYGLQVYGGWEGKQMIAFVSGHGGTGYQENYFHLISYTKDGYKEIWSGLAEKVEFGQLPYRRTVGSLNLSMDNQLLIYSTINHEYVKPEEDITNPDKVAKSVELYRYDPQAEQFVASSN